MEQAVSVWVRDQPAAVNGVDSTVRMIVIATIRNFSVSGMKKTGFGCFMPTPMVVDRSLFQSLKSMLKFYCSCIDMLV